MQRLLIANRGEIAVRILQAATEQGLESVVAFAPEDRLSMAVERATRSYALPGTGPAAYLSVESLIEAARATGCDALHPGYGFLSESASFARRCVEANLTFVGPPPEALLALGDKTQARRVAGECGVPVAIGSPTSAGESEARDLLRSLGEGAAIVIKAVAGGGGRGMRVVRRAEEISEAMARCRSEALQAFGNGDVYVERFLEHARHIEVQIVAGADGAVASLGERECSLQRRFQKLVEIAPSPRLDAALRQRICADAERMARAVRYRGLGTFEFLVADRESYVFLEANPRLQVEHTVTEEIWGVDLVRIQLQIADGALLADLALPASPRGFAMQLRINAERIGIDGRARPSVGVVRNLRMPTGPGTRIDSALREGDAVEGIFDPLLLKLVCHSPSDRFEEVAARSRRALSELRIDGVTTNRDFLDRLLAQPEIRAGEFHTRYVEERLLELVQPESSAPSTAAADGGAFPVHAPLQGTTVSVAVRAGDAVRCGQTLVVLNAMKMEHEVESPVAGLVRAVCVDAGDTVAEGSELVWLEPVAEEAAGSVATSSRPPDGPRLDLQEVQARHARTLDVARPDAIERRRKTGQRTARENIADLCDDDSFVEYGALVIAAQRGRRSKEELIDRTPADGLVAGIGRVNGEHFPPEQARCAVLAYDYTVLAGTQGYLNHHKKDRLFEIVERLRLPLVFFTEGGGGRPGDTDAPGVAGLDCLAFHLFARLSGLVPLVGVNAGRCFAGNAALLGCCDVVIATRNSNIGMGGPAMIEGGGLGVFRPEEIGPASVQVANGVIDILVEDEAEAVAAARKYLSYFQGTLAEWSCPSQDALRDIIPQNRLRIYDVRRIVETFADCGSVLELRPRFGVGMITALARIEGRPLGIVANNPRHLAGAIDAAGADKAARFLQLCDAYDLPVLFLCDTPGIMVGPEAEKTALVRHCSRLFVVGANLSVPFATIVLRKSYGLGAQAMGGGSHKAPLFTISWPTGEFGGMGLEGAVKLGFRKELEAIGDPAARQQAFEMMVARAYEHGKALNTASHFEIDDVIDPAESRRWIREVLLSRTAPPRVGKKRPCVDTW